MKIIIGKRRKISFKTIKYIQRLKEVKKKYSKLTSMNKKNNSRVPLSHLHSICGPSTHYILMNGGPLNYYILLNSGPPTHYIFLNGGPPTN